MERPQARIVDQQHVESEREITGWEAEQLLRKYGHEPQQYSSITNEPVTQKKELTFEEMISQEEAKRQNEEMMRNQKQNGPKPITFNGNKGYDSEVKYSTDEDTGFGFKIEISSDMKIPKY
jgi:uncharacterized protein YifE (UPF0438 family)